MLPELSVHHVFPREALICIYPIFIKQLSEASWITKPVELCHLTTSTITTTLTPIGPSSKGICDKYAPQFVLYERCPGTAWNCPVKLPTFVPFWSHSLPQPPARVVSVQVFLLFIYLPSSTPLITKSRSDVCGIGHYGEYILFYGNFIFWGGGGGSGLVNNCNNPGKFYLFQISHGDFWSSHSAWHSTK